MDFLVKFTNRIRHMFNRHHFFLVIRDDYISIIHMNRTSYYQRSFDSSDKEIGAAYELLKKNCNSPVYVILDYMDTALNVHSIPQIGITGSSKLVKRTLQKKYNDYELKNVIFTGKSPETPKHWDYTFATAKSNESVERWLDMLTLAPNNIDGFLLGPLELQRLHKYITHNDTKKEVDKNKTQWHLIILSTRMSGIRQIITRDGKALFTRLIPVDDKISIDPLIDTIHNDAQGTLQYIGRFGYNKDTCNLNMYLISAKEVGDAIKKKYKDNITTFTPDELITKINPKYHAGNVGSANAILCNLIYKHEALLSLRYDKVMSTIKMYTIRTGLTIASRVIAALGISLISYSLVHMYSVAEESKMLKNELQMYEKNSEKLELHNGYNLNSINIMQSMISEHDTLSNNTISLSKHLNSIYTLKSGHLSIKSVTLNNLDPNARADSVKIREITKRSKDKINILKNKRYEMIKAVVVLSSNRSDDSSIFTKYKILLQDLKEIFPKAPMVISELSATMDLMSPKLTEELVLNILIERCPRGGYAT